MKPSLLVYALYSQKQAHKGPQAFREPDVALAKQVGGDDRPKPHPKSSDDSQRCTGGLNIAVPSAMARIPEAQAENDGK